MIVVVCPGQGSQTPGFLAPWLELDGVRARLEEFSVAADVDLVAHGTHSDAAAIRDTKIAQPLIVAASIVAWEQLRRRSANGVGGVAGHSVGEFAALTAAGVLDALDAMRLVGVRGRAMAHAAAFELTSMSAVLGGEPSEVLARIDDLGLTAANLNGGGQIVAAGGIGPLDTLASEPPAGARVIPLQVAGAFHTVYMAPAVERLQAAAAAVDVADPTLTLWTNRDGSIVDTGRKALDLVVGQVASPVRWDACMDSFAAHGVTGIIELAPAGTLVGLAKRVLKGVPAVAVKTPADLEAAAELIASARS